MALPLGAAVALAYADIARARSILDRRPDLRRARTLSDFFWWLSWEFGDPPGEGENAPKDDLLTRILCASLDGRLQLAGVASVLVLLVRQSPIVSADEKNWIGLAAVLVGAAVLARLPARARRAGAELRRRATLTARVGAGGAVLLFALGTAIPWIPALIFGLLAAAIAFRALHYQGGRRLRAVPGGTVSTSRPPSRLTAPEPQHEVQADSDRAEPQAMTEGPPQPNVSSTKTAAERGQIGPRTKSRLGGSESAQISSPTSETKHGRPAFRLWAGAMILLIVLSVWGTNSYGSRSTIAGWLYFALFVSLIGTLVLAVARLVQMAVKRSRRHTQ